ncbi:pleckstrin homology domain-containing family G member 3-like isoform X2 [Stigmatopora nigra]
MPEGSHPVLHQGPMGEEYLRLPSPLSSGEQEQANVNLDSDCYTQLCTEPSDGEGERPVSLVSTLSSGSSRDSHSLFGSTVTLPSSCTPPIPSEEDINLELSPTECAQEQPRAQSPGPGGSGELMKLPLLSNQWNNNNASSNRQAGAPILHDSTSPSPVITETMAPNPKLTHVDRVVMEIIETERMYVKDLRSIVEDYLAHIIDTSNLSIRPENVCALFGNIEDIYEFNSELLQSLDMCDNDPVAIAQCFVDKSEYFEIYTQYCTNYPNSVAALTDCMRSKTLAKFFKDRQAVLKRSLPLGSFLLKPVQRILKYHLLLQEIAKHFGPDEDGYEVVQEAIDTMTGVAWYINDMKRKHEHAVRVQEIQSLLINWKGPDLTTCGELVLEGTFHVLRAKNSRTLFLFDKMLLITKRRGEHYVYKTHISCSTLMLLDSAKDPLLFSVIHFKHPKQPHTVQAKSVEEKRLWAYHIKRLILENHNAIVPPKPREAIVDNSDSLGKYHCSPERVKRTNSYHSDDIHLAGWNVRRRSEPAKQILKSTKDVLKHSESEGNLLGDLPSARSRHCPLDERPTVEESPPQLSSTPTKASPSQTGREKEEKEEEGESFKEDFLIGDDQVADFAGSVLAAISCWHYRARALLSSHFTTDDAVSDLNDALGKQSPKTPGFEEKQSRANKTKWVDLDETPPSETVPHDSPQCPSPTREAVTAETSGETGEEEGGSDSSGLQVEEISAVDDDSEARATEIRVRVLDQIAEHSIMELSLEDQASPTRSPPLTSEVFASPPVDRPYEEPSETTSKAEPPAHEAALAEGERRSTLSKRDILLISKIRRYYEHAEHQDANFSIKRRESLSYIPAGLVRQLSRQLDDIPDRREVSIHRKVLSRCRPTSWSVFDLPGIEKSPKTCTEPQRPNVVARSLSVPETHATADEEFRPSSEMLDVWERMEEKQTDEEKLEGSESSDRQLATPVSPIVEESESIPSSDGSSAFTEQCCKRQKSSSLHRKNSGQRARIISFGNGVDEDQILQDMGKMKNKVFQLARQYSQRIKNNRPAVWQKSREGLRNMPAVLEEKVRKKGKPNLRLPSNTCEEMAIREPTTPSPLQTPSSPTSSHSATSDPQSPQLENFHWPDVQELRSMYKPDPDSSIGTPPTPTSSSSAGLEDPTEKPQPRHDRPRSKLLCSRNSWDDVPDPLPLHEVQNLQEPVRTRRPSESQTVEGDNVPEGDGSSTQSLAKTSESNLVKSLRDRFQSLSNSS